MQFLREVLVSILVPITYINHKDFSSTKVQSVIMWKSNCHTCTWCTNKCLIYHYKMFIITFRYSYEHIGRHMQYPGSLKYTIGSLNNPYTSFWQPRQPLNNPQIVYINFRQASIAFRQASLMPTQAQGMPQVEKLFIMM